MSRRIGLFGPRGPAPATGGTETTRRTRHLIDGRPTPVPPAATIAESLEFADAEAGRMAVFFFPSPSPADVDELAEAWGLHPILVEDLRDGGQRPKLEKYDDVLFAVVRSARYLDEAEDVDFSEFHVLVRPGAAAVLCQDGRWVDDGQGGHGVEFPESDAELVARGDARLLGDEELLRLGPEAVLYRLLDAVVDGYTPVLRGVMIDKEEIERQVFSGDAAVAERIYRLSQEVIDLEHASSSLSDVLEALSDGFGEHAVPEGLRAHLQDVADHLTRVQTRVRELRHALSQILQVNATLVSQRQNEDMKKISGWAAILFAPTLIGAIYGMNFASMPELDWAYGYPLAIGTMVLLAGALYAVFKRKRWM